ncbi:hypothetical protein [Kitasatospora sp. DSM 101779]|uniref:hypothetical protein n=1 Tax=Kitasatospora sp. DSM 101779 TaxID=2853165 RepID=UPI0021D9E585|nr:hypothetical protein [Kitasatospora sp. DSM 101779]MCU7827347.1 hypothetical protein [Kitasatospora sp. DSM 101779]
MARRGGTHTRREIGENWHEHPSYIDAAWCAAPAGAVYQERVKRGRRHEQPAEAVGITDNQAEESRTPPSTRHPTSCSASATPST